MTVNKYTKLENSLKAVPEDTVCPKCGSEKFRIVFKDDEMTEVDFMDCLMCRHHWK